MAMAVTIDGYLGKEGILQMYLDAPYLGQAGNLSICGFEAASRHYWGKSAKDLSLGEAATLAGILPAPGRYGPDIAPKLAKLRRDRVLKRMSAMGYDVSQAREEPVEVNMTSVPETQYPSYMQATRAWLEAHLPSKTVYGAGLNVYTALDVVTQLRTEKTLDEKIAYLEARWARKVTNLSRPLVHWSTPTRAHWWPSTVVATHLLPDLTVRRRREGRPDHPSSHWCTDWHSLGWTAMVCRCIPPQIRYRISVEHLRIPMDGVQGMWVGSIPTPFRWHTRLATSANIGTASLLEELGGPRHLVDFADRLGFEKRWLPEEMGLALGQGEVTPLEMAAFVGSVVNGGRRSTGSPVLLARDAARQIPVGALTPERPVMSPEAAALTRELMRGVVLSGTGGSIRG